jgi:hypothetical protein
MKVDEKKGADLLYSYISTSLNINGFSRMKGIPTNENEAHKILFGKDMAPKLLSSAKLLNLAVLVLFYFVVTLA